MKVLLLLLQSYLKKVFRHFYWLYRLNSLRFGKHPHLEFPIRVEGKGSIYFGDNCVLQRLTHLGIGLTSKLRVGNNVLLENNSTIIVSNNSTINILDNFKLGSNSRIYVKGKWSFGNNVQIETNSAIFAREPSGSGNLIIGNGTHIGDNTIIDTVNDVLIGNEVAIGPNCTLYTHDHEYSDKNVPAWKGGIVSKAINIEDGAWIGSNVTILPGVIIGKRAVIAAGSVVTKNVESETIYGGIPAKKIKDI
jgi:acetyltransferase-like isoleucine patch superfamily enzyme